MRLTRRLPLFLAMLLVFSACGTGTPALTATATPTSSPAASLATPASTPSPTPTQSTPLNIDPSVLQGVNLLVFHAFVGPALDVFNEQLGLFNSSNQWGITVAPFGLADYQTLDLAVKAEAQSASPPSLVVALPEQVLAWDASGIVVDLNGYLNDPALGLGKEAVADIPTIFWAQDKVNGKLLGLPAQRSARFLFYNKTWAHELGFDHPPATADEFRQQACAANASFRKDKDPKNDGYGGWIVDTSWQTTYAWLLAFGGSVEAGNTYGFRTDPNLAALQFIKGLYDDHCAWLSTEPTPFDSFARRSALFVSGDLAEIPLESESMTRLKNADEWTVIPFPGSQESRVVVYGPSYTVMRTTPEKQLAAWLFARWLLLPENQAQWVEATGLFPLRSSTMTMTGPYQAASPQWDAAVGALTTAQNVPHLASWGKVRYILEDGLAAVFQANTPASKLPSMLDQMDAMAKELNSK